jgi:hypothetical protein
VACCYTEAICHHVGNKGKRKTWKYWTHIWVLRKTLNWHSFHKQLVFFCILQEYNLTGWYAKPAEFLAQNSTETSNNWTHLPVTVLKLHHYHAKMRGIIKVQCFGTLTLQEQQFANHEVVPLRLSTLRMSANYFTHNHQKQITSKLAQKYKLTVFVVKEKSISSLHWGWEITDSNLLETCYQRLQCAIWNRNPKLYIILLTK